ncbi:hypothetical protein Tco_0408377 [Tanacetum coccineum]
MSTQQDIYAAGLENRPPMLNKDNYVPWSSLLLLYAKIKPNKKLIVTSILYGLYVRRMIIEPGDPNRTPLVVESTHKQTDDELTKKESKQMEADDQAIQTILMGLPKDIYAAVDNYNTSQEIWLRVQQMMKGSDIGAHEKKEIRLGTMQGKLQGIKTVQNLGIQNVGNPNGIIVVPGIANKNTNQNGGVGHYARKCTVRPRRRDTAYLQTQLLIAQKEEAGIQLQAEEFDLMDAAAENEYIEKVNANCILMANLQQASTSGTHVDKAPVYDSDGSAELLESTTEPHLVQQNDSNVILADSSMKHSEGIVEQHPATVEETHAFYESLYNNLVTEVEKVNTVNRKMKEANVELTIELARYREVEKIISLHLSSCKTITTLNEEIANQNNQLSKEKSIVSYLQQEREKLKSDFKTRENELLDKLIESEKKIKECKYNKISYDKAYKEMQHQIERLQARLGDLKGKSMNTQCASNTLDPLSQKLDENVSLEFQEKLHDTIYENTKLRAQLHTKFSEQKDAMKGMFRINPFKNSRVDNVVPNKHVKESIRTKPITVSQPRVITKQDVNSNTNGLSSTEVESTAKTRRPQPRSITKNDRVPSASKSSCLKNTKVEVEKHHRNLLFSNNQKHMSSECNNIKLAIRNDKSKVICASCKKCLITTNHDVYVFNYVNGMNSCDKNQSANVSNIANQKKHKENVKKSKKLGNTRDLGSFGKETDEITDLHQILEEVLLTERGDGVASIKRRRHDLFSDGVWNLETASGRSRLKEDLESST